jgi:hypothetical protein
MGGVETFTHRVFERLAQRMCERGKRASGNGLFLSIWCCCHYPLGWMARCSYPAVVGMKSGRIAGRSDLFSETSYAGQAVKSIPSGKRAKELKSKCRECGPLAGPSAMHQATAAALNIDPASSWIECGGIAANFLGLCICFRPHAPTR